MQRSQVFSDTKKQYVSATVVVTGVERCLFVAPREFRRDKPTERVKFPDDLFDELDKIREQQRIPEFQMKVRYPFQLLFCVCAVCAVCAVCVCVCVLLRRVFLYAHFRLCMRL